MIEKASVKSKVLVIDDDEGIFPVAKMFCEEMHLVGIRATGANLMSVLHSNVDLGAILLAESYPDGTSHGIELARQIHAVRPELPIFLRRNVREDLDDLDAATRRLFCAAYTIGTLVHLRAYVDEYIFCQTYPNALVRGIHEITERVLLDCFPNAAVSSDTPYMVRDKIIVGEVFSLIPIENAWCRGYMMLQVSDAIGGDESGLLRFKRLFDDLGEITNLIWGSFKNRYIPDNEARNASTIQVPLLINLTKKFISFGTDDPQLCFKYELSDPEHADAPPVHFYQRFAFNLNWLPEGFTEIPLSDTQVASGEVEFF